MMPQNRTAPPPAEWRAEQYGWIINKGAQWRVIALTPHEPIRVIASELDEPIARLIANAPANQKLCEELADALEGLLTETVEALEWVSNEFRPGESPPTPLDEQPSIVQARAALKAAGRAPK